MSYSVDDPFGLGADHSAEDQLIASTVRDWVRRRFLPIVADAWRAASGAPNAVRVEVYSSAASRHARAAPTEPQTMP